MNASLDGAVGDRRKMGRRRWAVSERSGGSDKAAVDQLRDHLCGHSWAHSQTADRNACLLLQDQPVNVELGEHLLLEILFGDQMFVHLVNPGDF